MAQKLLPGTFARPPTQMTKGLQFKQNCGCLRLHSHLRVSSAWPKLQFCRDNCSKVSNAAPCTPQLPCSELLLFMFRAIQIVRCLCHQFCTVGLLRTKVLTTDFASSSVSQTPPPPSCHHSRQRILWSCSRTTSWVLLCKITEKHHHHRRKHPHHQCIGIVQVLLHLRAHDKAYFPSFCASALSNSVQLSTLCKCTHHGQSTKPPNCQTVYSGRWKHFVARCTLGCSRPSWSHLDQNTITKVHQRWRHQQCEDESRLVWG